MKIQSNGFRVTDICPQVPMIEVDGEGAIKFTVRPTGQVAMSNLGYMSLEEFDLLHEAIAAVRARLDGESESSGDESNTLPRRIKDCEGDIWVLVHDKDYVMSVYAKNHENCGASCDEGRTLEYIKGYWGPIEHLV